MISIYISCNTHAPSSPFYTRMRKCSVLKSRLLVKWLLYKHTTVCCSLFSPPTDTKIHFVSFLSRLSTSKLNLQSTMHFLYFQPDKVRAPMILSSLSTDKVDKKIPLYFLNIYLAWRLMLRGYYQRFVKFDDVFLENLHHIRAWK